MPIFLWRSSCFWSTTARTFHTHIRERWTSLFIASTMRRPNLGTLLSLHFLLSTPSVHTTPSLRDCPEMTTQKEKSKLRPQRAFELILTLQPTSKSILPGHQRYVSPPRTYIHLLTHPLTHPLTHSCASPCSLAVSTKFLKAAEWNVERALNEFYGQANTTAAVVEPKKKVNTKELQTLFERYKGIPRRKAPSHSNLIWKTLQRMRSSWKAPKHSVTTWESIQRTSFCSWLLTT